MKAAFNTNHKSSNGWIDPELDASAASNSYRSSERRAKDKI